MLRLHLQVKALRTEAASAKADLNRALTDFNLLQQQSAQQLAALQQKLDSVDASPPAPAGSSATPVAKSPKKPAAKPAAVAEANASGSGFSLNAVLLVAALGIILGSAGVALLK